MAYEHDPDILGEHGALPTLDEAALIALYGPLAIPDTAPERLYQALGEWDESPLILTERKTAGVKKLAYYAWQDPDHTWTGRWGGETREVNFTYLGRGIVRGCYARAPTTCRDWTVTADWGEPVYERDTVNYGVRAHNGVLVPWTRGPASSGGMRGARKLVGRAGRVLRHMAPDRRHGRPRVQLQSRRPHRRDGGVQRDTLPVRRAVDGRKRGLRRQAAGLHAARCGEHLPHHAHRGRRRRRRERQVLRTRARRRGRHARTRGPHRCVRDDEGRRASEIERVRTRDAAARRDPDASERQAVAGRCRPHRARRGPRRREAGAGARAPGWSPRPRRAGGHVPERRRFGRTSYPGRVHRVVLARRPGTASEERRFALPRGTVLLEHRARGVGAPRGAW